MKYSILGFNQAKVCAITKEVQEGNKSKTYKLDMVDLVVLQDIADFMNRKNVIKYTLNEKIYFSITHNAILTDLPILDIKKQALKDRIDKMCLLGVIEKHIVRNDNGTWIGYRLTDVYERLAYSTDDNDGGVYQTTWGGCSELHEGGVSNYTPNINTTIKESTIKEKEEDIIISSKKNDYQAIIECWNTYNGGKLGKVTKITDKRKKAIKKALVDNDITQEQLMTFFKTLPLADKWLYNPNKQHENWKPDFDWWMANVNGWLTKALEGKVHLENPQAFSVIMLGKDAPYTPECGGALSWNDYYKAFIYVGYWDGHIPDGYTDENRPDGATVMLNNGRGNVKWSKEKKQWIKE